MKRFYAFILALVAVFSLTACGKGTDASNAVSVKDATELMSAIWNSYADDEKFAIIGGDIDHTTSEGPAAYSVDNTETLDSFFGLSAEMAPKVDDAASLMHMMNANTFTGVAFHVTNSNDVKTIADSLKTNILNRQWLCGFPDKLIVFSLGDYIISVYGNQELVDTFREKTMAVYETAELVYDEPIV